MRLNRRHPSKIWCQLISCEGNSLDSIELTFIRIDTPCDAVVTTVLRVHESLSFSRSSRQMADAAIESAVAFRLAFSNLPAQSVRLVDRGCGDRR